MFDTLLMIWMFRAAQLIIIPVMLQLAVKRELEVEMSRKFIISVFRNWRCGSVRAGLLANVFCGV